METSGGKGDAGRLGRSLRAAAPFLAVVVCLWLGWQIVRTFLIERAPPELAIRVAPASPSVLARAAESELAASRHDNARVLAADSLSRAPFNARALRVFGLTEAQRNQTRSADDLLTLAGNWSLRDDPAHAWLIENRLRRGDYNSAFSHADTLIRRRTDIEGRVFRLFTLAATTDPKALPPLVARIRVLPPWREAYLDSLLDNPGADNLLASLAVSLQPTAGRMTDGELQKLYLSWLKEGRIGGIGLVRNRINRPSNSRLLVDGDFDGAAGIEPFVWRPRLAVGLAVDFTEDDIRADERALRVQYDGYGSTPIVQQLIMLKPGSYSLSGQSRFEPGSAQSRMSWTISCLETGRPLGEHQPSAQDREWRPFTLDFVVPRSGCTAQYIVLLPRPEDDRTQIVGWFDHFAINPRSTSR